MTVSELVEAYAAHRMPSWTATPRGELNTLSWRAHAGTMLKFFGSKTLGELCEGDELRSLCHRYAASRNAKPNTIRKQLATLVSPLRWACDQRWIAGLPPHWLPPVGAKRERELSKAEIESLLAVAEYPTERHIKVFTYLTLFTPAQKHAILNLTWDRVDFARGLIVFDGRGHQARRQVPMNEKLREVLKAAEAVKERGCKHVISWRGKPVDDVQKAFRVLLAKARIDGVTLNDLRKWSPPIEEDTVEKEAVKSKGPRLVISYCTKDGMSRASALCDALEEQAQDCWIAPRDMGAGPYAGQIIEAIEKGIGLIVVLTPKANQSSHVLQEVNAAHDMSKTILPVIVGEAEPANDLRYYLATPQQVRWTDAATVADSILTLLKRQDARKTS